MPPPAAEAAALVTTLRLLDLDLLPDWPAITSATWLAQDAQQSLRNRIRATEWALYRLFELFDASRTREKLSPFFPPLEPLQSTNLRAALYRLLAQLKKDGAVPSGISILKTTLEECKWEKIGDVLLYFSVLVLRKIWASRERSRRTLRKAHGKYLSQQELLAKKLALETPGNALLEKQYFLPLILAHEARLCSMLSRKRQMKNHYSIFSSTLDGRFEAARRRDEELRNVATLINKASVVKGDTGGLGRQLCQFWHGNNDWLNILTHGESRTVDEALFGMSEDEVWEAVAKGQGPGVRSFQISRVEELERVVTRWNMRDKRWRAFQENLESRKACIVPRSAQQQPDKAINPRTRFFAHQGIVVGRTTQTPEAQPTSKSGTYRRFYYLGQDMDAQLEQLSKSRKRGGAGWSDVRPSIAWIAPASIKDQDKFVKGASGSSKITQYPLSKPIQALSRASPTRPSAALSFQSTRTRSPKALSGLFIHPHPSSESTMSTDSTISANTEITDYFPSLSSATLASLSNTAPSSPLSLKRRPTLISQSTETMILALPTEDPSALTSTSEEFSSSPSDPPSPVSYSGPSAATDQIVAELGRLSIAPPNSERLLPTERTLLFKSQEDESDALNEDTPRPKHFRQTSIADRILDSVTLGTPTPVQKGPRLEHQEPLRALSLTERTRMSLAHMHPGVSYADLDPDDDDDFSPASPHIEPPLMGPALSLDRRASLLDRTRESMARVSAVSNAKSTATRKSARQSRLSLYPINQFETPVKRQTAEWGSDGAQDEKTAHTPKEQLFSEDADVASVFKSRPRVALSPAPTPRARTARSDEGYDG